VIIKKNKIIIEHFLQNNFIMENISLFKNFIKEIGTRTLAQIVEGIKGDHYKESILKIRGFVESGDKEKVDRLKKGLVAFTVSGKFAGGRKMSFLKTYNPLVILDIDKLDPEALPYLILKIKGIAFTRVAFISPSGRGLKIIVEVDSEMKMHGMAYRQVMSFYEKELGVKIDKSGKDITRLCFMSYDPEIYFNPESCVYKVTASKNQPAESANKNPNLVPRRAPELVEESPNLTLDYADAFDICVARTNGEMTFEEGNRNNFIYRVGVFCVHAGIPLTIAIEESKKRFDFDNAEMQQAITSAYNYQPYPVVNSVVEIPSETLPTIPARVFDKLPALLRRGCQAWKEEGEQGVFLTGALGVLSSCLPEVSGIYDGDLYHPNLFVFVVASEAGGRSAFEFARILGADYDGELLELSKVAKVDFKKASRKYKVALKKFEGGETDTEPIEPEQPKFRKLFITTNISSTMLIRALNQNEDSGILFETVSSDLGKVFRKGWGGALPSIRKSFHHETLSFSREKNIEFVEVERPELSIAMSGDLRKVKRFISSIEDPMLSRFLFYNFEESPNWQSIVPKRGGADLDDIYQNLSKEVLEMVHFLKANKTKFTLMDIQWEKLNRIFRNKMEKTNRDYGSDALSIVMRMGLTCFRFAMILSAIRKFEEKNLVTELVCKEEDFEVAVALVEVYMEHSLFIYDQLPGHDSGSWFGPVRRQSPDDDRALKPRGSEGS